MRIISDFHDYYDGLQSFGQDDQLLYLRKEKEECFNKRTAMFPGIENGQELYPFPWVGHLIWGDRNKFSIDAEAYTIGFCGKIYPLLWINFKGKKVKWCFSLDEVDAFIKSNVSKEEARAYARKGNVRLASNIWPRCYQRDKFQDFYQWHYDKKNSFEQLFTENKCPIFVGEGKTHYQWCKIKWNGMLKDIKFYRVFDATQTFQELSMYLGGLASPEKPIPHIDDKIMVEAKGFDKKLSFRKSPKKK